MLKALGVCGSPRGGGNTETLLDVALAELERLGVETEKVMLSAYEIRPCTGCRYCVDDDMSEVLIPKLVSADIVVIASPVYFNNVSSYVKVFMDRTWCIRGRLRNKVRGGIVVGRGYGLESALTAIHSFMLKHEMIVGHRGVAGIAFEAGEVHNDRRALEDAKKLARRLHEIAELVSSRRAP